MNLIWIALTSSYMFVLYLQSCITSPVMIGESWQRLTAAHFYTAKVVYSVRILPQNLYKAVHCRRASTGVSKIGCNGHPIWGTLSTNKQTSTSRALISWHQLTSVHRSHMIWRQGWPLSLLSTPVPIKSLTIFDKAITSTACSPYGSFQGERGCADTSGKLSPKQSDFEQKAKPCKAMHASNHNTTW